VTQGTTSVAVLEEFIRQFENTPYGPMARARLEELKKNQYAVVTPPANTSATSGDVTRKLQIELRRVGCFTAEPDGDWNARSRNALELFNKHSGASLDTKLASLDALDAVRGKASRICPLICAHGQHVEGDQCIATVCKAGYEIGDDGSCQRIPERQHQGHQIRLGPWERVPGRRAPARAAGPGGQQALPPGIQLGCPPAMMPCATDRIPRQ
jgi:hypothetical protein